MKTMWIVGLLGLVLTGCTREMTFETVSDEVLVPAMASPSRIQVKLPQEAGKPVMAQDGQELYLYEGYEIYLENHPSGDLKRTIRCLTGFDSEKLTVLETGQGELKRYEFAWSCAGEGGQRLGRGMILDDGSYHYCLSVLRDADEEQSDACREVFASFDLI